MNCYWKNTIYIKKKVITKFIKSRLKKSKVVFDVKKKYAFIFLAADYNNLGDIAITYAQHLFLANNLPGYEIIEIPVGQTYSYMESIKKLPKENVLITLIGGGNNGTLYEFIEEPRRFILREFRNYKIVSFPQTILFEDSDEGNPYKDAFIKTCKRCSDLTLVAREEFSYDSYKKIVENTILLTPDIVFSLCGSVNIPCDRRENWIACILRDDKEKAVKMSEQEDAIEKVLHNKYILRNMDTCDIVYNVDKKAIITNYLTELSKAHLAITDRLHGMIFCYITKTPCVVLENNNHKIRSTFETWLSDQNFIILSSYEKLGEDITKLLNLDHIEVHPCKLFNEFEILKEKLR